MCSGIKKKTTEEFISEANQIHQDKFDYSKTNYINAHTKIEIICQKHSSFWQEPNNHLNKQGCPICNLSKGEEKIKKFLIQNNIIFISQKKFKKCKYKRILPFDFYLPESNTCIEYDGKQHFTSVDFFGGVEGFELRKKRDKIKTNYCYDNHINLLRIAYNEDINKELKRLTEKE